jgi:hypothetical protein
MRQSRPRPRRAGSGCCGAHSPPPTSATDAPWSRLLLLATPPAPKRSGVGDGAVDGRGVPQQFTVAHRSVRSCQKSPGAELQQLRTDHHDELAQLRREAAEERAALRREASEQLAAVLDPVRHVAVGRAGDHELWGSSETALS